MINAYKIGVELALTGNVARVIADLTRQFETLNTAVKSVQGSLVGMTGDLRSVAEMGRTAARSWTEAANAMGRARASMPGGGGGGSGGGGGGFLPGFAGGAFGGCPVNVRFAATQFGGKWCARWDSNPRPFD